MVTDKDREIKVKLKSLSSWDKLVPFIFNDSYIGENILFLIHKKYKKHG